MVDPIPTSIQFSSTGLYNTSSVRTADSNIVDYQESTLPQEMITHLLFEDLGGHELINISRHDVIDGTPVSYDLIGNLSDIQNMFNSNNIISGFEEKQTYFNQYTVDIGQRINTVWFDEEGNLVIDFTEINSDEMVEIQLLVDGILYEES